MKTAAELKSALDDLYKLGLRESVTYDDISSDIVKEKIQFLSVYLASSACVQSFTGSDKVPTKEEIDLITLRDLEDSYLEKMGLLEVCHI